MKEIHILVVDRKSGLPLYMNSSIKESDSKAYLFSGLMTVVNQVISEFDSNRSKKIVTNQHTIFAREMEDYFIFILGEGSKERLAVNLLEYIRHFLQSFPSEGTELPDIAKDYLDRISEDFFKIYSRDDLIPIIYLFSKSEGLKELTFQGDTNLNSIISAHLSKMEKFEDAIVFVPIDEKRQCSFITRKKGDSVQVLALLFNEFRFIDFLSYRHKLIIFANEHLERYGAYWEEETKDILEAEKILHELATSILQSLEGDYFGDIEITDPTLFFEMTKPVLPSILTAIVQGRSLAIVGTDEVAKQMVFFISSITGIYDISNEFKPEAPARIMLLQTEMDIELAKDLGYIILDTDNLELNPSIKPYRFFIKEIDRIIGENKSDNVFRSLSEFVHGIWETVDDILLKIGRGADRNTLIKSLPYDEKIIKTLLGRANPQYGGKQVEKKVVNW